MASERMRTLLPYISIGVGILVYILYYNSTQSWKQAQSDYERQQVEERQAKQRADTKFVEEAKPWISDDGNEIYKIVRREQKDGLTWIKVKELNEGSSCYLKHVESASGDKYTSKAGNLFWINGDKAIFENAKGKKSNLKTTHIYKGLYSYMADANSFKLCDGGQRVSIAMLGNNASIEQAYSKFNRSGEPTYLEIEGIKIKEMGMEGTKMVDAIYPYKLLKMEDRISCE